MLTTTAAYTTEYYVQQTTLASFTKKYHDVEKYLPYCKACPNYNTVWSCPPLAMPFEEHVKGAQFVNAAACKILFSDELRAKAKTADDVRALSWPIVREVKDAFHKKMLHAERSIEGSVYLASGGCTLCASCARKDDTPCRNPRDMRYSIDAFGFDLTAITEDFFGIKLLWSKGELPAYYTLVHVLFTKEALDLDAFRHLLV